MPPEEYPLPSGSLEQRDYRLLPDSLEDDDVVLFHATPATNLVSILENGIHPGIKFGGVLETISYGETTTQAMTHRMYHVQPGEDWVLLVLKFQDRSEIYIDHGTTRSRELSVQPEVLGFMRIPAGYRLD